MVFLNILSNDFTKKNWAFFGLAKFSMEFTEYLLKSRKNFENEVKNVLFHRDSAVAMLCSNEFQEYLKRT